MFLDSSKGSEDQFAATSYVNPRVSVGDGRGAGTRSSSFSKVEAMTTRRVRPRCLLHHYPNSPFFRDRCIGAHILVASHLEHTLAKLTGFTHVLRKFIDQVMIARFDIPLMVWISQHLLKQLNYPLVINPQTKENP